MTNDESNDSSSFGFRASSLKFHQQFPADFISEAIDQTRGWFYSQLAISTMLWSETAEGSGQKADSAADSSSSAIRHLPSAIPYPHPFRNCIVLGLMLGEDGQKMSKSKRNYREPNEIFDKYGADALRWYLFANQAPWTSIRYSEQAIKDSIPEFLLRLWNCYSFFVIYANIDQWAVGGGQWAVTGEPAGVSPRSAAGTSSAPLPGPPHEGEGVRNEIDRWIISELHRTLAIVTERMDAYDNFAACGAISEFVDALSNWYVRRSRDRFWMSDKQASEKLDAYATLFECLVTTCKMIAPFVPFVAEAMWRNLSQSLPGAPESVHLCDYPLADAELIDQRLSQRMAQVRLISSLGRRAREGASLKVRQPLSRVEVIMTDVTHQAWLEEHASVIADELNVKAVEFSDTPEKYVSHTIVPNFKLLGPKLGKLLPQVKAWLNGQSGSDLLANIRDNGRIDLVIEGTHLALTPEEVEVRIAAKPGYAAANDQGVVVVLATELTPELVREGLARDLVRVIQDRRKELGCEFTDRIAVGIVTESAELAQAVQEHHDYIAGETLADSVVSTPLSNAQAIDAKVSDAAAALYLHVIGA